MTSSWFGVLGSIIVAAVAFAFGRVDLQFATKIQRAEDLRRRRVDTYAAFCVAVIAYRRAQLRRWYVREKLQSHSEVERQMPGVAEDVRESRADAWGRYYEVLMLTDDDEIATRAREVLRLTKSMKDSQSSEQLDDCSNRVHEAVREFAVFARKALLIQSDPRSRPRFIREGSSRGVAETVDRLPRF